MISKIAIGTAQFGLDYGINNKTGQVSVNEIIKILDFAKSNEISFIDTAYLYGNSESRLGEAIVKTETEFNIISKLPKCSKNEVRSYFLESLNRLNKNAIYGYLYHNFETFLNDESTFNELLILREKEKVKKIGFSLYYPSELEIILNKNIQFDLLQVPYNLLDRRFETYFLELSNRNIEIHIRSVFLQGLFFKKPNELSLKLLNFKNFLISLTDFSHNNNFSIEEIALKFALRNKLIDKVVIGIDNLDQFSRLIDIENNTFDTEIFSELEEIIINTEISEEMLIPSNWS